MGFPDNNIKFKYNPNLINKHIEFSNSCIKIGNFKNGYGEIYWNDGDIYKGYFNNDVIEGYGEYYCNSGNVYKGNWKDGNNDGKGRFTWNDKSYCVMNSHEPILEILESNLKRNIKIFIGRKNNLIKIHTITHIS